MNDTTEKRRGPGRPSNRDRATDLTAKIEAGLRGVADMLERHDESDADSFSAILKRDARRQAEWLAAIADNHQAAERAVAALFGAGSLLGFAGAWGPLVGRLITRIQASGLLDFQLDDLERVERDNGAIPLGPVDE